MGRGDQRSQDALNAAWRAPREETKEQRPSSIEEIELPHDDNEELELDETAKNYSYGNEEVEPGRPAQVRTNGPKRKAA